MMLIQLLKVSQDAPDGLYLHYHNSRIQDIFVGPFGVQHPVTPPPFSTGVVQRSVLLALASCTLIMVMRITAISQILFVSVPSGV
jgi:hypothetical protein